MEEKVFNNLQIRSFEKGDRELVQDFFDRMSPETVSMFNVDHGNEKRALAFFDGKCQGRQFFLASETAADGRQRMIGYVFIRDTDRKIPWLGIAVSDDCRGKHLGEKLLLYIREVVESYGGGGILLKTFYENIPAQRLYERVGFERIGNDGHDSYLFIWRF